MRRLRLALCERKNMKKLITVGCICFLGLNGCSTTNTSTEEITSSKPSTSLSQKEYWNLMIGRWYGSQPTKNGGKKEEIMEKLADGTYKITFRVSDPKNGKKESVEVGQWGISGSIYFSIFRGWVKGDKFTPSDPTDPYNYDAYRIINLTNKIFEYEHVTTGNHYTTKKVPVTFVFQE
jgi:hypothetical protein